MAAELTMTRRSVVALQTLAIKEIRRFLRIWPQTLVPSAITMSLYFLIFGEFIGKQLGSINGVDYIDFIAPGLIMMAVISNSYANVVSSFFSAKFQRHVEEMLVSPMPNHIILLGFMAGGVTRGLLVGIVVTGVSMFFTDLHIHNMAIAALVVVLTAMLFSIGGFINAIFARKFDDVSIVPTFVLTPLTYLGGVFYSIERLPTFWQNVSKGNPILYMVDAFRYGFLGIRDMNVAFAIGVIVAFIIGLFTFALYLLNRGVGIRT